VSHPLLIVGAGPAGVSAALWARSSGLEAILLEAGNRAGGQLTRVHSALVGVPGVIGTGGTLAAVMARQLAEAGIALQRGAEATALVPGADGLHRVVLARAEPLQSRAILVATGLRARTLDVPGERELAGRGVSTSATRDRERFAGQPVVVAGGGDAAYENALLLSAVGCPVTLVVRGAPRARPEFRERVAREPRITLLERTRVVAILGEGEVSGVRLSGPGGERTLGAAAVFVKVGPVPNTEWCRDALAHDADGYLRVDPLGATSRPGVWAAGDVIRPPVSTVAAASASGALSAAAIRKSLRGA
jgi:thioredoxin reductase (NADPH)